ncbi:phenolic glucoside malonyltransferase 2-like [Phalaenopsis equestris]|uniref:phenolic glucoside malonyltransferase 2-like n=1 Tax=Phalaenopsis equestris TaxID=78828 RepID=UPI0009E30227|nr:phenolic glucoside malonyltransferase 2-like [Phalaenopsis equestris]
MAAVRVLHEIQISPSPLLPTQPPQPLSYLDSIWLRSSLRVERLFFYDYPHPISHFRHHELPNLTKSLSLALRHFYLLAGSIRPSPVSDDQFEIAYTEGDSVPVTVAEFIGDGDDDFRSISGHQPRDIKTLRVLVPKQEKSSSGGESTLLSIQITLFRNKGICVCFATYHAACDGSASMQFIRSWAAAHQSPESVLENISPPFLDRSVIVDTHRIDQKLIDLANRFKEMLKENYLKEKESLPASEPDLVSASFTLSKDQIARLKERVRSKGVEKGKPTLHISAFVVTCAHVWRCLEKARENEKAIKHYFSSAVDWRSRMKPAPLPSNYFGNCVGACVAELEAGELVGKEGLELAAMEIGKCIDGLQGRDIGEVLGEAIDLLMSLAGSSRPLSVAGSPKLGVYETDFGWGKPVKVEITSIHETGAISLAESRGEEGGLEIGLVLPEEEMKKFGNCFSSDLLHV